MRTFCIAEVTYTSKTRYNDICLETWYLGICGVYPRLVNTTCIPILDTILWTVSIQTTEWILYYIFEHATATAFTNPPFTKYQASFFPPTSPTASKQLLSFSSHLRSQAINNLIIMLTISFYHKLSLAVAVGARIGGIAGINGSGLESLADHCN